MFDTLFFLLYNLKCNNINHCVKLAYYNKNKTGEKWLKFLLRKKKSNIK